MVTPFWVPSPSVLHPICLPFTSKRVLPPPHLIHPHISLPLDIKFLQDQVHPLPLRSDKAALCYICAGDLGPAHYAFWLVAQSVGSPGVQVS